jgi:hypothetical protein
VVNSKTATAARRITATTGLLFLLMFVTGTLLSLGKAANEVVQVVHEVVAVLAAISTSGAVHLLTGDRR